MSAPEPLAAWHGETVVIKLGGELITAPAPLDGLLADVVALERAGVRVVLVHGGGPQADALAAQLGHEARKVDGRRVTTATDLVIATYLYGGALNLAVLGALMRQGGRGMRASGLDGGVVRAVRRPPVERQGAGGAVETIDFGHVGDVTRIDTAPLLMLLANGLTPVVAPLAADETGAILNMNADTVATQVALALGAAALVLASNVPGVLDAQGAVIPSLDGARAAALIADGTIGRGMIPKVRNALAAADQGVGSVHIVDGRGTPSPLLPLFSRSGIGTAITAHAPSETRHG